ncbi:hypothetical protein BH23BAC1_BH23BAC1_10230 [soil metagenome]
MIKSLLKTGKIPLSGFFLYLLMSALAFGAMGQTVTTDKLDYAPGEIAIISGTGWTLDAKVDVHLDEDPLSEDETLHHDHSYHNVVVNEDGTWQIKYPIEWRHLGVAFTVIAVGQTSGFEARAYFTDDVNTTPANATVSADKAVNSVSLPGGEWTILGNIVIAEGNSPTGRGEISGSGTIVLNAPANWTFNPDATINVIGNCSATGPNQVCPGVTIGSITKSTTQIVINITVNNTGNARDVITISGIQVKATNGALLGSGDITWTGDAIIAPTTKPTLGTLTQVPGAFKSLSFKVQPSNVLVGTNIIPAIEVEGKDQHGNIVKAGTQNGIVYGTPNITLALNSEPVPPGGAVLAGSLSRTINNNSTEATFNNININVPGTYKLKATSLGLTEAVSSSFIVSAACTTPTITSEPANVAVCAGDNTTFTVVASGDIESYNWQVKTNPLGELGAWIDINTLASPNPYSTFTTATLNITGATFSMNGYLYRCVVSGCSSNVESGSARLTVRPDLTATIEADEEVVCSGSGTDIIFNGTAGSEVTYNIGGGVNQTVTIGEDGTATVATGNISADVTYNLVSVAYAVAPVCSQSLTGSASVTVITSPTFTDTFEFKQGLTILAAPNVAVGSSLTIEIPFTGTEPVTASFTFVGTGNEIIISDDDISKADSKLSATIQFNSSHLGVYIITAFIENDCGSDEKSYEYVVVFGEGMVTGGGWVNSPLVTVAECSTCEFMRVGDRANFGFVAMSAKGKSTVPTGNTVFQFHAGNLNFKSTAYEWLVVSGTRAQYKGTGSINGAGNYKFMLTAIDDSNGDRFRIKITNSLDEVLYDNQVNTSDTDGLTSINTSLGGGSIVIHKPKGNAKLTQAEPSEYLNSLSTFEAYPNPMTSQATIKFSLQESTQVSLRVYDLSGREIANLFDGEVNEGAVYEIEFAPKGLRTGIYLTRLTTSSGRSYVKRLVIEQ